MMPSIRKSKADGKPATINPKVAKPGSRLVRKLRVNGKAKARGVGPTAVASARTLPGHSLFRVKSTSSNGTQRHLTIEGHRGKESAIKVHRMGLVGPEDKIYFDPANSARVFVRSTEDPKDLIRVTPHFERRHQLRLGARDYLIVMKEVISEQDFTEYEYLEGFHYKTSSVIVSEDGDVDRSKESVGGRKAALLAYVQVGKRMVPAGYIELHMPLLMVRPRHVLFDHGFHHPSRPVSWEKWDISSMRKYVNLIVRIARVVTSPDLRGLGLAKVLISTAREYVKERWHVNGRRPLFMEISAEMLKYMDFASSAGLHFIGNTEGNLSRVHADLLSMQRGQKVSFGIMTLQKKYLTHLSTLAKELGRPLAEVLERLKEFTKDEGEEALRARLNKLEPQEWYLLKKALRFPIPYFMCGLDEASEEFVSSHAAPPPARLERARGVPRAPRIFLKDVRVTSTYEIPDSANSRAIRDCFGLDGRIFKVNLVGPVSIEASGGNIILITGPSGSGKSVLLRVLDPKHQDETLTVSVRDKAGKPYEAAWMNEIEDGRPLIEHFSSVWGMEASISALNQAGLSEAFVYLRPYRLLSRGQQYRARLAALMLGTESVWLMDEFGADLDPFTARIVANNLRKAVMRTGRIAIVAAANNAHYIDALRPSQVIYLRHNGKTEVLNYKEYVDEFCLGAK